MPLLKGQGCKSTPRKAIAYITDAQKAAYVSSQYLDDGRDYAEQFRETARLFGKGERYNERKYYHFKLSCDPSDNVSATEHHKYAEALAAELFRGYECVIATHTDTKTVHSHIIVNAICFETGKKLRITNQDYDRMKDRADDLGEELGFSRLDRKIPRKNRSKVKSHAELRAEAEGRTTWKQLIKDDIDAAIVLSLNFNSFLDELQRRGYSLKIVGDMLTVRPPEKERYFRLERNLGDDYTIEMIRYRLHHRSMSDKPVKIRHKRARVHGNLAASRKLTGFRARYMHYCYLFGLHPRERRYVRDCRIPYFALKDEIMKLDMLSEESMLLAKNHIYTMDQLMLHRSTIENDVKELREKIKSEDPSTELISKLAELKHQIRLCNDIAARSDKMTVDLKAVQTYRSQRETFERAERNARINER